MDGNRMATAETRAERLARGEAGRRARRDAILEAATEMFLEAGYGATSIDRVIRRVGGSKSTLYAYFDNKAALFAAVVERVLSELAGASQPDGEGALGLEAGLRAIGLRLARLVLSERHIGLARLVIAESRRFPEVGRIYYERGPEVAYARLSAFLAERARCGEADIADPRAAAEWFAGKLIHRAFLRSLCLAGSAPSAAEIRREVDEAVAGFLALYAGGERDAAARREAGE